MNGGNACICLFNSFKRTGFDADSIKVRYIIRKMKRFQIKQKFKNEITILNAPEEDLKRNRIEVDDHGYHCVGQLIRKKNISKIGFFSRIVRSRSSSKSSLCGYSPAIRMNTEYLPFNCNKKIDLG